jgi:hypothetical protein
MRGIVQLIAKIARLAPQTYRRMRRRERMQLAVAFGLIGLLALVFGIYSSIDATDKYNVLDAIPTPDAAAAQQMSQADLMLVAQVGLAKRDLLARRAQASSAIGAGAALFGLAALIFITVPEERKSELSPVTAPSTPAIADPRKSAEAPIPTVESADNRHV